VKLDEFEVRPTLEGDVAELNALYLRVIDRRRSFEQWRREWRASPYGPGRSWSIRERSSGRLVGHHGLIEVPLRAPTGVLRAARTENTMVDPEYRTALYYPAFEAQLLAKYRGDFDAFFTAAGTGAQAAMRRRFGYRPVARWIDFTPFETLGYRAGRDVGAVGRGGVGWIGALRAARPAREFEFELTRDVERVERLWRRCEVRDGVEPERSAAYLRWRLLEHPWHEFRLALLVRAGRDVGFVAWREAPARRAARRWVVEDAFTEGDDEPLHRAWLEHLAFRARWDAVRIYFRATRDDGALARAARKIRGTWIERAPKPAESELLVLAPQLPREWTWNVSTLIDQGI
jgi:hypothetical protein